MKSGSLSSSVVTSTPTIACKLVSRISRDTRACFFGDSTGTFRTTSWKRDEPWSTYRLTFGRVFGLFPLKQSNKISWLREFERPLCLRKCPYCCICFTL